MRRVSLFIWPIVVRPGYPIWNRYFYFEGSIQNQIWFKMTNIHLFRNKSKNSSVSMPGQEDITLAKDTTDVLPPAKIAKLELSEANNAAVKLKFAKLSDKAFTPTRGSKQAAGFDLYR